MVVFRQGNGDEKMPISFTGAVRSYAGGCDGRNSAVAAVRRRVGLAGGEDGGRRCGLPELRPGWGYL